MKTKMNHKQIRRKRVRRNVKSKASSDSVRLCFIQTNKYIYLQAVDTSGKTIKTLSTQASDFSEFGNRRSIASSAKLGEIMALSLKSKKIKKFYFDRGEKKYHGRVKACAEAARNNGLTF